MFEQGKTYKVYDKGTITIQKRTKHYVTFTGDFSGRKKIDRGGILFGNNEYILIETGVNGIKYFVVAR